MIDLYSIALGVALATWAVVTGYVLATWATKRWQLRRDSTRRFFVEAGSSTLHADLRRVAGEIAAPPVAVTVARALCDISTSLLELSLDSLAASVESSRLLDGDTAEREETT